MYAHIFNNASRLWNGSAFEAYVSGNYNLYTVNLTEQGTSGVFVGDFPVGITIGGHYEAMVYFQDNPSAQEGDPVHGTIVLDWDGDSIGTPDDDSVAGELDGSNWEAYVLRVFRRTDKSLQLFDETNAAISEIRRKFTTQRDEKETTFTDVISTLGEYRLDVESDLGLMVSDVFVQDTNDGFYLDPISKQEYDRRYSIWGNTASDRDRPRHYCLYGGQILLGPIPDRIDYTYKTSYGRANLTPVTAASDSIPYTTEEWKEGLRWGTLYRLYAGLENDDQAGKYKAFWDNFLGEQELKEKRNRRIIVQTAYQDV